MHHTQCAGSQLEANKKAMNIQCKVCMQTFICTTSEVKCREHAEARHPKSDVSTYFPHLQNFYSDMDRLDEKISSFTITTEELQQHLGSLETFDQDDIDGEGLLESEDAPTTGKVNREIHQQLSKSGVGSDISAFPSGTIPMMQQSVMSQDIQASIPSRPHKASDPYLEATSIVHTWAEGSYKGITKEEIQCLTSAIMSNTSIVPRDMEMILLGFHLRGEHNIDKGRNVLNSMQELLNGFLTCQKGFDGSSKRIIEGVETAVSTALKIAMSNQVPPSLLPSLPFVIPTGKPSLSPAPPAQDTKAPPNPPIIPKISSSNALGLQGSSDSPRAEEVNNAILKSGLYLKGESSGAIKTVTEFCQITNRDEKFLASVVKVADQLKIVQGYLETHHVRDVDGKVKVWDDFVKFLCANKI